MSRAFTTTRTPSSSAEHRAPATDAAVAAARSASATSTMPSSGQPEEGAGRQLRAGGRAAPARARPAAAGERGDRRRPPASTASSRRCTAERVASVRATATTRRRPNDSASSSERDGEGEPRPAVRQQVGRRDQRARRPGPPRRPWPSSAAASGRRSHGRDQPAATYSVAHRADGEHPGADRRARRRRSGRGSGSASTSMSNRAPSAVHGPGAPGDPAVDRVEQQGDGGERDQESRPGPGGRRSPRSAPRPRRPARRGPGSRGRPARAAVAPVPASRRVERHPEGRAAAGRRRSSRPAPRPTVADRLREQREQPDEPGQRSGLNPMHRASVSRGTTLTRQRTGIGSSRQERSATGGDRVGVLGAEPGRGEIRPVRLRVPGAGRGPRADRCAPAISRGTETLVFRGGVPVDQHDAMRAPFQEGDFPGPVKYGYLNVGVVEQGPPELLGRTVFCLHPHQTAYVVPAAAVTVVPDDVPPERAVLAGTVETAVNALWDAAPLLGDRVAVVGRGHGRLLRGPAARRHPGCPGHARRRRPGAGRRPPTRSGVGFAHPDDAPRRLRPRRARQRDRRRPADLARPARRTEGEVRRPQLVRRRAGRALAGRGLPLAAGSRSAPARWVRSRRPAGAAAPPPTGSRWRSTCCGTRPSTPCSPAPRRSTSCPR